MPALLSLAAIAGCLLSDFGLATPTAQAQEFVDKYNKRFETKKPLPGDMVLNELSVFDEQGQPVRLDRLKGKHTVLVFGCLT